jgi:hypothetical protein
VAAPVQDVLALRIGIQARHGTPLVCGDECRRFGAGRRGRAILTESP